MELTVSYHRSRFFWSSRKSSDETVWGSDEGAIEGIAFFVPSWHIVLTTATWDTLYGRRLQALAKSLVGLCLLDVFLCPEVAISQQIHL